MTTAAPTAPVAGQAAAAGAQPKRSWMGPLAGLAAGLGLAALASHKNAALSTTQSPTPYKDITTYNNFYEFGTSKSDPSQNAGSGGFLLA